MATGTLDVRIQKRSEVELNRDIVCSVGSVIWGTWSLPEAAQYTWRRYSKLVAQNGHCLSTFIDETYASLVFKTSTVFTVNATHTTNVVRYRGCVLRGNTWSRKYQKQCKVSAVFRMQRTLLIHVVRNQENMATASSIKSAVFLLCQWQTKMEIVWFVWSWKTWLPEVV